MNEDLRPRNRRSGAWLLVLLSVVLMRADFALAQTMKLKIAYSSLSSMATGIWMAQESGAYQKYGIDADLIFISSGPVVVQALIGGDLHGGVAATNAVVNAILSGAPIIGVGGTANRPYHRLFVHPEINRMEDLRGKTLGVTRFGSITDNLTRIVLRRYGLEGAVSVRQLGGTTEVGAAYAQKVIAGAVTSDLRPTANTPTKILLNLIDLGIPYSMNSLPVSRDFYRRHPDKVEGMVRAYAEGVAAMNLQKERTLKVIAKYSRLTDAKSIEDHYQDSAKFLDRMPRAEPDAVATILEFAGKKGVPFETFADTTITDKMAREGFIEKLYKRN